MDPTLSYEASFQKLRGDYIVRLGRDEAALRDLLNTIGQPDILAQARALAHGLSGSGATFGFPDVSKTGGSADIFLTRLMQDQAAVVADEDAAQARGLLTLLIAACQTAMRMANIAAIAPAPSGRLHDGAYVLLVDDDGELASMLSAHLNRRGIHVVIAASGTEALKILERQSPDLMILDVMMPGLSGNDVLKHLNYDGKFSLVPVILMSATAPDEAVAHAKRLGIIDYLQKPVAVDRLMARVDQILDAAGYHVVIADNDTILLRLLQEKFHQRGFRVGIADDGKTAWDMIFRDLPDLVVIDRMMPGMDGLAVVKNMRGEPETEAIPVVVVSARKEDRDIKIGLQMGAQDYVIKPCDPEDLLNRSLALLQAKAAQQKRTVRKG